MRVLRSWTGSSDSHTRTLLVLLMAVSGILIGLLAMQPMARPELPLAQPVTLRRRSAPTPSLVELSISRS